MDPNTAEAFAKMESSASRPSTNVNYKDQWEGHLAHCADFGEGSFQLGKSTRQITKHINTLIWHSPAPCGYEPLFTFGGSVLGNTELPTVFIQVDTMERILRSQTQPST